MGGCLGQELYAVSARSPTTSLCSLPASCDEGLTSDVAWVLLCWGADTHCSCSCSKGLVQGLEIVTVLVKKWKLEQYCGQGEGEVKIVHGKYKHLPCR